MAPRAYRLGQRATARDETRRRIVEAARAVLAEADRPSALSVHAVARRAGVARTTVYNQFESRAGLLSAVLDDLSERGGMGRMAEVFRETDPAAALRAFVETYAAFWATARPFLGRVRALAALDPEGLDVRDSWRRRGSRAIVDRWVGAGSLPAAGADEAHDVLFTLTSFETYDALAGVGRTESEIVALVLALAGAAFRSAPVLSG